MNETSKDFYASCFFISTRLIGIVLPKITRIKRTLLPTATEHFYVFAQRGLAPLSNCGATKQTVDHKNRLPSYIGHDKDTKSDGFE